MIRDQHGHELKPGDLVLIPARVVQLADEINHRHVHVETLTPGSPGVAPSAIWLNGRQLIKAELPPTQPPPAADTPTSEE